jgi:hypothetical protein
MKIEKYIATLLASLMAASTFVGAALANDLSGFPGFLYTVTATASSPDYWIVVGADAAPSDVVGAIDLASRLAEGSYTIETVTGVAVSAVEGVERDDIGLSQALSALPGGGVMKNFHFSGLLDSTFAWRGDDYDFHEQVDVSGVQMRHDYGTSGINGTEKMEIESGDVIYQYVFDEALTGTGSIADPNYTYPIYIELLGVQFALVGTGSNKTIVLKGSIGTATDTVPVTYGDYSVYSDLGSNDAWARILIKDAAGNLVDTLIIDQGDSKDSAATGLSIKVTAVRALTDGTIVGVDLVVGPRGQVEKTYDTTADTTSPGAASDVFPGETDWGIRVKSGTFATAGQIAVGDTIEVVYQPTETQYLVAGEKLILPNDYAELGFEGWNTEDFVTVTVRPVANMVGYDQSDPDTQVASGLNGLEVSVDVSSSIGGVVGGNWYSKAYALIKYDSSVAENATVYFGFYDATKEKILVNSTVNLLTASTTADAEFYTAMLNALDATYPFKLRYGGVGDVEFTLKVKFDSGATDIVDVIVNDGSEDQVTYDFENKTALSTSATPEFRLGSTVASAESAEVSAYTEDTPYSVGKASQDVVADGGIIVLSPATYGAADKAVFDLPAKALRVKVYFGEMGAAAPAEVTYHAVAPITSAVAKLDTEIGTAEKARNIITVGGPCINRITAEAMGLTYPACGEASTIPEDSAIIEVMDDVFTTGKVVVVVAGWEAEHTRLACSVLQNYDAHAAEFGTAAKVIITGTTAAPSITQA